MTVEEVTEKYNSLEETQWKNFLTQLMVNLMQWYTVQHDKAAAKLDDSGEEALPTDEGENG